MSVVQEIHSYIESHCSVYLCDRDLVHTNIPSLSCAKLKHDTRIMLPHVPYCGPVGITVSETDSPHLNLQSDAFFEGASSQMLDW